MIDLVNTNNWHNPPLFLKAYERKWSLLLVNGTLYETGWWLVLVYGFNATSVISWLTVLLMEEIGVTGVKHRPVASHWQTLLHNVVSSTSRLSGIRTHNVSGDRHYHTIMTAARK